MLCLIHRHPALATQLMSHLWPQIWNRLLLQQSTSATDFTPYSSGGPGVNGASGTSSLGTSELPRVAEEDSADLFRSGITNAPETKSTTASDAIPGLAGSASSNNHNPTSLGSFSATEIRGFVLPQIWRFLTSDQHVNPTEPQPCALGAFLSCLATTSDTVLMHIPLPAITVSVCMCKLKTPMITQSFLIHLYEVVI